MQWGRGMSQKQELQWCVAIIVFGLLLAFLCIALMGSRGYPYDTFLYVPSDSLHDFRRMYASTQGLNPYAGPASNYFPLAYLVFLPFTWMSSMVSLIVFYLVFSVFLFGLLIYYTRGFRSSFGCVDYLLTLSVFYVSYPVLRFFDRGNIEGLVFIFVAAFLVAYQKKWYYLSVVFLLIAIGMKGFPAVFLVLFLKDKKYKAFFLCIFGVILFSLLALASFTGSILDNVSLYMQAMSGFQNNFAFAIQSVSQSASLWGALRVCVWYMTSSTLSNMSAYSYYVEHLLMPYAIMMVLMFLMIAVYIMRVEKAFWKNIALLMFVIIMFPTMSYDYKLLYLLPLFLLFLTREQKSRFDGYYLVLLALLFIPKNYYVFEPSRAPVNDFINIGIMFAISVLIIYDGVKNVSFSKH